MDILWSTVPMPSMSDTSASSATVPLLKCTMKSLMFCSSTMYSSDRSAEGIMDEKLTYAATATRTSAPLPATRSFDLASSRLTRLRR